MLEVIKALKIYGKGQARVTALNNVSLQVNDGDFIAIMGPSGSGKSTLLNVIGGMDNLSGGTVLLNGKRIDNLNEDELVEIRRKKLAYVFQQYYLLPALTAIENVMLPLMFCGSNGDSHQRAINILKVVGLERRARHKPGQLSGGEQQRVAIARAIINDPSIILADEPTGNMDQKTGGEILALFDYLNRQGRSIVMVTHSLEVAKYAREIVFLRDGEIVDRIEQNRSIN